MNAEENREDMNRARQAKGRPKGKLKDGRTISCYIRSDIYEALIEHCERTGQTKTIAIERAIEKMTKESAAKAATGTEDGNG